MVGRDETPRQQWQQALLLGVMGNLFLAPAYGFPLVSAAQRYDVFLYAIALFTVTAVLLVKRVRRNRAVRFQQGQLVLVEGEVRTHIPLADISSLRYELPTKRLVLGGVGLSIRLSPQLGLAVVRSFAE